MRVLIGCECSGVVRDAFRRHGHDAWSCDLKPCEGDPRFHIQGDLLDHLADGWGFAVFHPECKYLCSSGLHWNHRRPERAKLTEDALAFVLKLMAAPIERWALENSTGCISTRVRKPDQIIQPYQFGADASKATCLWLRNTPPLTPTIRVPGRMVEWPRGSGRMVERWANQTDAGQNRLGPSEQRSADRARTYPGVAEAMAAQWSAYLEKAVAA